MRSLVQSCFAYGLGAFFITTSLSSTAPLSAQASETAGADEVTPPPQIDAQSPTGVSITSGAYNTQGPGISIGAGEWPHALSLQLQYSSSSDPRRAAKSNLRAQGWQHSLYGVISVNSVLTGGEDFCTPDPLTSPCDPNDPINEATAISYTVSIGQSAVGFIGPKNRYNGDYTPNDARGDKLEFNGSGYNGSHIYTNDNGDRLTFRPLAEGLLIDRWEAADGTIVDYTYSGIQLRSVSSSRGYALLFEIDSANNVWTKACAINLSVTNIDVSTANCPATARSISFAYQHRANQKPLLLGVTDAEGDQTTYQYSARDRLTCVRDPGASSCSITNTYNQCVLRGGLPAATDVRHHDQVVSQITATGETYSYNFDPSPYCPPEPAGVTRTMTTPSGDFTIAADRHGRVTSGRDQLNRQITQTFALGQDNIYVNSKPLTHTLADGNEFVLSYNDRGNLIRSEQRPRTGFSDAPLVTSASLPSSCTSSTRKVCNKPSSVTDANGNTTNFEYSSAHGGVLKRTLAADASGVRPETRYTYAQKYAWLKSGSGYVRAATPVWVLVGEEFCRSSAADANGNCAGGAADEVVTTYEYEAGSASKGSNILMIGTAVTADGQTLRSCYGYDDNGRRISETQPKAGLASCPS